MKKILLTTLFALLSFAISFGQFVITSTSVTYTGNAVPAETDAGQFYANQPGYDQSAYYYDNACTDETSSTLGGWDLDIYAGPNNGVIFYGGGIRRIFYGTPCTSHDPAVGFHTGIGGVSGGIGTGTDVDLSLPAYQKITFTYTNYVGPDYAFELQLFDEFYTAKLSGATFTVIGDGNPHTVSIDFSGNLLPLADMTNIRQVTLAYTSETPSGDMHLSIYNIYLGSSAVTGVNKPSIISSSNLFPNPSNGQTSLEFNLAEASDVKVVVTDMIGKQIDVVLDNNMNAGAHAANFNVSEYSKGIYYVNYFINNEPAKMQMLLVK